jgi:hypothetical protein
MLLDDKSLVPYRQCSACRHFPVTDTAGTEQCGYGDLEWAAGVCGRCGQSMGIESTFACNRLK